MEKIILFILFLSGLAFPQTIYDVTPGTKGNRIIISLENESKVSAAKNVEVKLVRSSQALIFNNYVQVIKKIKGPSFRDKRVEGVYTLHKTDGQWKIYDTEITKMNYLN